MSGRRELLRLAATDLGLVLLVPAATCHAQRVATLEEPAGRGPVAEIDGEALGDPALPSASPA